MFVRNIWYVAGWDTDVPAEGLFSRTICSTPIVFWRDAQGRVQALMDRCCHRGARLSLGRKEQGGDQLRCMYHGLVFDRTGQCVGAPQQPRIPPNAKVRSFPLVERHRWIWIWMGDPQLADPALIPDTHWLDDPRWRSREGYLHYDVNYLLITDNLLDLSHIPFLHPGTVGGSADYAAVLPKVERNERGVRSTKWVRDTEAPAYSAKYADYAQGAPVDRWMFYDFVAPGILLMDSGMMPAGSGLTEPDRDNAIAFRGCQAVTPETQETSHYFFAHPRNFLLDSSEVTDEIHAGLLKAFDEDREMITEQGRNLAMDPDFKMVPLSSDTALSQFRWVIDKLIRQEQTETREPAREEAHR